MLSDLRSSGHTVLVDERELLRLLWREESGPGDEGTSGALSSFSVRARCLDLDLDLDFNGDGRETVGRAFSVGTKILNLPVPGSASSVDFIADMV